MKPIASTNKSKKLMLRTKAINLNRQALLIGFVSILSSVASIAILAIYINAAKHGIDFTDEGFYFNSIHDPARFTASLSFFGKAYNPIYKLVDENIKNLRIFNILTIFITSYWLSIETQAYSNSTGSLPKHNTLASLNAVTIAGLSLSALYLMTPNYNSLALTGCIVASIFFLRITQNRHYSRLGKILNISGLSIALIMTGLAKATSLASVIACLFLYITLNKFKKGQELGAAIGISLLVILPFYIHLDLESMTIFNERITEGFTLTSMLGSSHGGSSILSSIVKLVTEEPPSKKILLTTLFVTLCIYRATAPGKTYIRTGYCILGLILFYFTFKMQLNLVNTANGLWWNANKGRIYPATIFAAISIGTLVEHTIRDRKRLIQRKYNKISSNGSIPSKYLAFFVLASMPISYAIGTDNILWWQANHALIFYALCSIILISKPQFQQSIKSRIAILSAIFFITAFPSIQMNITTPYRQNSTLLGQSTQTQINNNSNLLIDEERSNAINKLKHSIKEESKEKISIIDLTGHFPGLVYAIGAKPVGANWMIGGYPGSNKFSAYALKQESQDTINESWVLIEKNGRSSLDHKILQEVSDGKKSLKTMKKVVEVEIPVYNKNFKRTTLQLYKNVNDATL